MTGTENAPVIGRSWQPAAPERQVSARQNFDYMVEQEEMTVVEICDLTGLDQSTTKYLVEGGTELSEETCQKILAHTHTQIRIWLAKRLAASRPRPQRLRKRRLPATRSELAIRREDAFDRLALMRDGFHLTKAEIARLVGIDYSRLLIIIDNQGINITRGTIDKVLGVTDESIREVLSRKGLTEAQTNISDHDLYRLASARIKILRDHKIPYEVIHEHTGFSPSTTSRLLKEPVENFERGTLQKVLRLTDEALRPTLELHSNVKKRVEALNRHSITKQEIQARSGFSLVTAGRLLSEVPPKNFRKHVLLGVLKLTDPVIADILAARATDQDQGGIEDE